MAYAVFPSIDETSCTLRHTAEHEAAHAIVAAKAGFTVTRARLEEESLRGGVACDGEGLIGMPEDGSRERSHRGKLHSPNEDCGCDVLEKGLRFQRVGGSRRLVVNGVTLPVRPGESSEAGREGACAVFLMHEAAEVCPGVIGPG